MNESDELGTSRLEAAIRLLAGRTERELAHGVLRSLQKEIPLEKRKMKKKRSELIELMLLDVGRFRIDESRRVFNPELFFRTKPVVRDGILLYEITLGGVALELWCFTFLDAEDIISNMLGTTHHLPPRFVWVSPDTVERASSSDRIVDQDPKKVAWLMFSMEMGIDIESGERVTFERSSGPLDCWLYEHRVGREVWNSSRSLERLLEMMLAAEKKKESQEEQPKGDEE